jgi:dienelactone hydrolase
MSEVSEDGLVAAFFKPEGIAKAPALIVLGGSEGGKDSVRALAKPFAGQGYAVLALSWQGAPGLPASYVDVPLEYFDTAIAWLSRNPSVEPGHIGTYGVSKGAEAALLVASRSRRLHAAAAGMPASVVFQGGADTRPGVEPHSSWTVDGKPVPFVPYDVSQPFDFRDYMGSIFRLYDGGLKDAAAHADAVIPVERINGPILLISGEADAMWPAARMSNDIVKRLERKRFGFSVTHLSYPDAGHAVGLPPALGASERGPDEAVGGTAAGNAFARADMWPKLVCFFDGALRGEKGTP